jgi:hypothetical protein
VSFERIDDSRYKLTRGDLPTIIAYIDRDYEITADKVRRAVDKYGVFDVYVTSNPNATSVSPEAIAAAKQSGRRVFLWRQFLGALGDRPLTKRSAAT